MVRKQNSYVNVEIFFLSKQLEPPYNDYLAMRQRSKLIKQSSDVKFQINRTITETGFSLRIVIVQRFILRSYKLTSLLFNCKRI